MKSTEWMSKVGSSDSINKVVVETSIPSDPTFMDSKELLTQLADIRAAVGSLNTPSEREIVVTARRPQSAVLSYGASKTLAGRSGEFRPPFHDYGEIARAVDTESFLARSIQKHREYILKEGYEITGSDPEAVAYVRKRLFLFGLATGISAQEWIRELVTNLVTYSTCLLVLKRDASKSIGRSIRVHGKRLEPIAGLFPLDPVSVRVKQNLSGRPLRWRQEIDGRSRTFDADDVLNITIDRKSGFVFGTPYSVTVLDDIRALRRLEELVEMVAHKHLFPLFHVKVGTESNPAQDMETPNGTLLSEVDIARDQIEGMPSEGGLVTSERYEIQLLGAEGKVLDLKPYIDHFKERVMSGLRLSPLDLGQADTGNKATAQVVNRNLVDAVKDFQRVISDQITMQLFDHLLLEGGFDLTEETRVKFTFPTADREEERSQQQHGLTLYQSNAITCEELRLDYLKRECFTSEQESDTWHERYEKPQMEAELQLKRQQAASSNSGSSSSSSGSGGKDANRVRSKPQNQHGILSSKPTFPANDTVTRVMREWDAAVRDSLKGDNSAFKVFKAKAESLLRMGMTDSFKSGANNINGDNRIPISLGQTYIAKTIPSILQETVDSAIIMCGNSDGDPNTLRSMFDATGSKLEHEVKTALTKANRYGYVKAAKANGYSSITGYDDRGSIVANVDINLNNVVERLLGSYTIDAERSDEEQITNIPRPS